MMGVYNHCIHRTADPVTGLAQKHPVPLAPPGLARPAPGPSAGDAVVGADTRAGMGGRVEKGGIG